MRLSRTSLLERLTDADAPRLVVLEAPTGFGKSWLMRKAAPADTIRVRGSLGPLADDDCRFDVPVIVDDAHRLEADQIERLVEIIEDAPPVARIFVVGRIIADELHDIAHLVDGLVLDSSAIAVSPSELMEAWPEASLSSATQLIDAADGCIKVIAAAVQQAQLDGRQDAVANALHIVRATAASAIQSLNVGDAGLVGLLARAPGLDQVVLAKLGGAGFLDRIVHAGIPLRRRASGAIELVFEQAFLSADVDPSVAGRLANSLIERGRPMDAVRLLVDAGVHDRAARLLMDAPESVTRGADPRDMLTLLGRLGTLADREPALLLLRASSSMRIGRVDLAGADIEAAQTLASTVDPPMQRRVSVEAAEWLLIQGRRNEAIKLTEEAIRDLGPGEDRTYARAHSVLADAASTSVKRSDLQRAAESYRVAAAAWEGCGEAARARLARCDLAAAVLQPLGRFDEALAVLGTILAAPDLTDSERLWVMMNEGFVLMNANRLDSAESRFARVAELGYLQDNPRMIALAAWGQAMVAARRDDVAGALRWFGTAENTALGVDDELLDVPFRCDAATVLGALGEMELAERHLVSAQLRESVYPDLVQLATFVFDTRRGVRSDVRKQLDRTPPSEWWRVLLLAALAAARDGDVLEAQQLLLEAERELVTLGLSDFAALGERRAYEELRATLRRTTVDPVQRDGRPVEVARVRRAASQPEAAGRRLRVMAGEMALDELGGLGDLPPGNPRRLVGVVVASGGVATFDQISEALWPGDDVEASRNRLRNVLMRLRRGAGDVVVRSGAGVRLAPDVVSDLQDFDRLSTDALSAARSDPELAGHLAEQALDLAGSAVFGEFEYEEWVLDTRRSVDRKLIAMLDLLSVQAEDAGDLARAQSLAERALRLDRYSDSRYVRLAELLTMQGRSAAATAVLQDATEVSREMGATVSGNVKARRDDLMRRAANS